MRLAVCLGRWRAVAHHGVVRTPPALQGSTTSLGFVPALVVLLLANYLYTRLTAMGLMMMRIHQPFQAENAIANAWMLGALAAIYLVWILAVARLWVTAGTGGGFVVAGAALSLRSVAEMPALAVQTPLAEMYPPDPYGTVLPLARGLGLVAYAFGIACVVAACLSERRLRRSGPRWTLPR